MPREGIYSTFLDKVERSLTNKAIVLDLDETLLKTYDDISLLKELEIYSNPANIDIRLRSYALPLKNFGKEGTTMELFGIERPHLQEFLSFCFEYFQTVAVWSAGKYSYVHKACDHIFRNLRKPDIIFTWDDCQIQTDAKGNPVAVEKPLRKLYEKLPDRMSTFNTFALDDRFSTFSDVNLPNGVLIPSFDPPAELEDLRYEDPSLVELRTWLLRPEVIYAKDVQLLDKSKIFSAGELELY